jgi:hypothetical protein
MLVSCAREYEFERQPTEIHTLGHELFKIWRKDAERSPQNAAEKTAMLDQNYGPFVDAVDAVVPESELSAVDQFLQNLLRLVDDGTLPALSRKLRIILDEAAQDGELLDALVTPTGPDADTFVQPSTPPNLLGYATAYPRLPEILEVVARVGLNNDGLTPEGVLTFEEPSSVTDMTRVLVKTLRETKLENVEPLAVTVRDLALVENPEYMADEDIAPVYVVLFDSRGYPLVANTGSALSYPFVDQDGDGLADINEAGEFIFQNGQSGVIEPFSLQTSIEDPTTRDAYGRALAPTGPVFQYVDIHTTGLGFLVREFRGLSNEDTLYDMLNAFQAILGPKVVHTDEIGAYTGYAANQPLMDLSYAAVHTMDTPALPDVMDALGLMLEHRPDQVAGLVYALTDVVDTLGEFPNARMDDDQTMVYDLLPYLQQTVDDPALWADLMKELRDPINRKTGEALATLLRYRDNDTVPVPNGPYDACFQQCAAQHTTGTLARYTCIRACPNSEIFSEPMDYSAQESFRGRSLLQKFMHLIRDTAGVEYTMNIAEARYNGDPLIQLPPLLSLPGSGEAYLASIAGNLNLADYVPASLWSSDLGDLLSYLGVSSGNVASLLSTLSPLFGAELDVMAKPHQITRLFNQPDLRWETDTILLDIEDPVGRDHFVLSHHLAYGLFVGEAAGVIDTMVPLARAFSDHKKEHILTGIFSVIHDHYAGDASLYRTAFDQPSEMKAANLRSYEPALEQILNNGELFEALNDFAVAAHEVELITGKPVAENLRQFLAHTLKQDGFKNHRGEDYIVIDDTRTISNPSRMHFLIHAVGEASKRLDDVPESRERLRASIGNIVDVAIGAEKLSNGEARFIRPGSPALLQHVTAYMAQEARTRQARGDFSEWLTVEMIADVESLWTSRMLASTVDLGASVLENPQDKEIIDDFVNYLFGSHLGRTNLLLAVHQLLIQSVNSDVWLPVGQFLARAIDPDRTWNTTPYANVPIVTLGAQLLAGTLEYDPQNTGIFMFHRGLNRVPGADSPFGIIAEVIAAYFSPQPLAATLETPQDYRDFLIELGKYVEDDVHGIERLFEIVSLRNRQ